MHDAAEQFVLQRFPGSTVAARQSTDYLQGFASRCDAAKVILLRMSRFVASVREACH